MGDIPATGDINGYLVAALGVIVLGLMGVVTLLVKTLVEIRAVKANGGGPDLRGIFENVSVIKTQVEQNARNHTNLDIKLTILSERLTDHINWEMNHKYTAPVTPNKAIIELEKRQGESFG